MHIEAIAVYHRDGRPDPRLVRFRGGRMNVVSGVPNRGKSALLEIVDYCMGRSDFTVPEGVVRDTVSWYGVCLSHDGERTWALRPEPSGGNDSTAAMMLVPAAAEEPPRFVDLAANADTTAVRAHLDARLGIEAGEVPRDDWRLRTSLRITVAQAVLLCLQGQNEVMHKSLLFHRQDNPHVSEDLQASLPYFLGAVDPESPALRARLQQARRALERARRRREVSEAAAQRADERIASLLERAAAAELPVGDDPSPVRRLLLAVEAPLDAPPIVGEDEAGRLLSRRTELASRRRDVDQRLRTLRALDADARAFAAQVSEQAGRLHSLGLLPDGEGLRGDKMCPACGSEHEAEDPSAADFQKALSALQAEIEQVTGFTPRASRAIEAAEAEKAGLDEELATVADALRDLAAEGNHRARLGAQGRERAFVQGRIAEYLEISSRTAEPDLDAGRQAVEAAEQAVADLESQLDESLEQERIDAALDAASEYMTAYARRLNVEHVSPPATLRLNLKRMTAVARSASDSKWLPNIGGGSNWLGWHLAVHLGLHALFAREKRPVPRFLMLDQPTQAWYPEDLPPGEVPNDEDVDRSSVRRMFKLICDFSAATGVQVIVCDHAKLVEEEWFMESLEHDWRGPDGLIPDEWRG